MNLTFRKAPIEIETRFHQLAQVDRLGQDFGRFWRGRIRIERDRREPRDKHNLRASALAMTCGVRC